MYSNSGWGKDVESHKLWLMVGPEEPGSIKEYDPVGKTFIYGHVADINENILFDICGNKILAGNEDRPQDRKSVV